MMLRAMTPEDYDEVRSLWEEAEGMSLHEEDDCREAIVRYLRRNRGLCFVAESDGKVVGTVLCGHDGRRAILRHLAVASEYRGRGIARLLVDRCRAAVAKEGIRRVNVFVLDSNREGRRFWEHLGWVLLEDDFRIMQRKT